MVVAIGGGRGWEFLEVVVVAIVGIEEQGLLRQAWM